MTRTRFERVDLGGVVEDLLRERDSRHSNGQIKIAFARPHKGTTMVMGDTARLVRVVENLVDNAVSFSPENGVVKLGVVRSGSQVILSVEDEGPGIPENARDLVFNRFHTDRPEAESFGRHSGLGLPIAKTIVEGHDGTIEITSPPNGRKGARLIVTLPAATS
jgi:two-component system sensor histidine kinase ChvG